jgi:predicted nucleic acid-binding Zn ribbon protein
VAGIVLIPMPTYVYKFVKTGETIEVQQSFTDSTLTSVVHPRSGRKMAVKKVFTPVGVTFRGDGFYKTDSRAKSTSKSKSEKKNGESGDSKSTDSSSSSSSSTSAKSDAPKDSKKSEASTSTSP